MKSKQITYFAIGMIILISLVSTVLAHGNGEEYSNHHGMMSGFYGGYAMGIFGWAFMVLLIVAMILLIAWLIKQLQKPNKR